MKKSCKRMFNNSSDNSSSVLSKLSSSHERSIRMYPLKFPRPQNLEFGFFLALLGFFMIIVEIRT